MFRQLCVKSSMYNCLTYVTCSFDNDHNQNMLKQPLHLVICLPLRTAVSGSSHITHDYLPLMAFDDSLFMAANSLLVCYKMENKKKSHYNDVRTEFKEALLLIQASFAVCISKYKFNE
ncbi:hypothetical protein T12_9124 [Trichinella patagoniensis]|uniref:Uncharacterized protein n=1 Tax=Trichinella patagoniensis TaxID=990121 RepID=A0A0V1AC88_9BILA|nr:hypothetical protein T12_9124 [Trichinella patagoniensis]